MNKDYMAHMRAGQIAAGSQEKAFGAQLGTLGPKQNLGHLEQLSKQLDAARGLKMKLESFSAKISGNGHVGDVAMETSPVGIFGLIGEIQTNIQTCHALIDELNASF